MKKTKVVVIDSGIANYSKAYAHVVESYVVGIDDEKINIHQCETMDYLGHGSVVGHIICDEDPDVEIISFRIYDNVMTIKEDILVATLHYIEKWIDADIINISAGLTYSYKYNELREVCAKIYEKGILIVAAFDNNGAISYPAMFKEVIGVDVAPTYDNKKDVICVKNGIVDVIVPDKYYRSIYSGKSTILKGTSFASAYITGIISRIYHINDQRYSKIEIVNLIKTKEIVFPQSGDFEVPEFTIKKAIVFPVNKETHALLKYSDLLSFDIVGVYDEKLAGRIGESLFGYDIMSFDAIKWDSDFDTIILSCSQQLTRITKRCYSDDIHKMAEIYNKNVYSFEDTGKRSKRCFYPGLSSKLIPYRNNKKLHQNVIPVVGIWGTSSKQGKYSLQLELIRRMRMLGYNTGHISSEPSGYLFDADFVFHYGYNAELSIEPWECIAILNEKIWEIQNNGKDIVITGGQSGTIPYSDTHMEPFFNYQYAFMSGVRPDYNILCINPHDDYDYVKKTKEFISSMTEEGLSAMVLYPVQAIENITGIGYNTITLDMDKQKDIKQVFSEKFNIPVYLLSNIKDLDCLCNNIIDFFAEQISE